MSNCNWPDLDEIARLPTLESSSDALNYYYYYHNLNNHNHNPNPNPNHHHNNNNNNNNTHNPNNNSNPNPNPNNNPPMMPSNNNDNMWNLNYNPSSSPLPLINSSLEEDYYTPTLLMNNLNLFSPPLSTNPTLDSSTNNGPLQVINSTTSSTLHQPPHHGMLRPLHQYEGGEEKQQQGYMFLVKSESDVVYDGYCWRKYGEKKIKNRIHPRSYYKCAHDECKVRKQVERSSDDPTIVCITYYGHHTHEAATNFLRSFQLKMIGTVSVIPSS